MSTPNVYTNRIVLKKPGRSEDLFEGGYTEVYEVISCDIDPNIGTLEYQRIAFCGSAQDPEPEISTPPRKGFTQKHVSSKSYLNTEEIEELCVEHGITFAYDTE
jgi:hypothetical protein